MSGSDQRQASGGSPAPRSVKVFGLLGLIPFLAPPLAAVFVPALAPAAGWILALYGALILSFLGGARFAFSIAASRPRAALVSLSMLPTLVGFGLLLFLPRARSVQLVGLALALVAQGALDARISSPPPWYPRLRILLTLGAVLGLALGVWVLRA